MILYRLSCHRCGQDEWFTIKSEAIKQVKTAHKNHDVIVYKINLTPSKNNLINLLNQLSGTLPFKPYCDEISSVYES